MYFFVVKVQNMVKKWVSRWHDGRQMSLRTHTSTVIVSEQMSLQQSTSRDEVQSKTRGVHRQVDHLDLPQREVPEKPTGGRGVNGFGPEQSSRSLLEDEDKEHDAFGCEDGKTDHRGLRQHYDLDVDDEFDDGNRQRGQKEEDDDDQDIIKEDLV